MVLPVFGTRPWNDWDKVENKPGKRLGTCYSVLKLKNRGPVIETVKVPGAPVVEDETVRNGYKNQMVTWVNFTDYDSDVFVRDGVTYYTATAATATLVDDTIDIS